MSTQINDYTELKLIANALRILSADAVEKAKTGHPGTPVGAADLLTVLFAKHLVFNPQDPRWLKRDRFVLSAGHACALLYSLIHLFGNPNLKIADLQNLRQLHSKTPGHPERDLDLGIEVTTGPLGEGVSMAVGLAIAERKFNHLYDKLYDNHTYAFVGDGCLMEGVSFEALSLAGELRLDKLIVIYDSNQITIDGSTKLAFNENIQLRMEALGFDVQQIDGHNYQQIDVAITKAKNSDKPSFIIANTIIAKDAGDKAGTASAHGAPLGELAINKLRTALNWEYPPFVIPREIYDLAKKYTKDKLQLYDKFINTAELRNVSRQHLDQQQLLDNFTQLAQQSIADTLYCSLRQANNTVLNLMLTAQESLGGSADLSNSTSVVTSNYVRFNHDNYGGNFIHYGVREHAMGAIINGIAGFEKIFTYGSTFLVFSDFLRPAIRLAAIMNLNVLYIFTHDSISLGGDGATHQPIEHLDSLALIPNLKVIRPSDIIEIIECYQLMLTYQGPIVLSLGRQDVPTLREHYDVNNNLVAKGGYQLKYYDNAYANLISYGSELHLCVEVAELLKNEKGIYLNIISMPDIMTFSRQSANYKKQVLDNMINIVIGASTLHGWKDVLGSNTYLYNLTTFGVSAAPQDVLDYYGFNVESIKKFVLSCIEH